MKSRLWAVSLLVGVVVGGCTGAQTEAPPPTQASKPQTFNNPTVPPKQAAPRMASKTVPGLLQATNATARLPTISVGRADPFAPLPTAPVIVTSLASTAGRSASAAATGSTPAPITLPPQIIPLPIPVSASGVPGSTALPPLTTQPVDSPSQLPPVTSAPPEVVPPLAPPASAPVSRTALAELIEVSGAVQVGGRWSIIVKESSTQTSRYVKLGDYLENGKVLVKRVIAQPGADPLVVLQQNGVEVVRSVGSATGVMASRQ